MLDTLHLRQVTWGRLVSGLALLAAAAIVLRMVAYRPLDLVATKCPTCEPAKECPTAVHDKMLVSCNCPEMPTLECPKCLTGDMECPKCTQVEELSGGGKGVQGGEGGGKQGGREGGSLKQVGDGKPQVSSSSNDERGDLEEITSTGAWRFNDSYVYPFDLPLAEYLGKIMEGKTVLELGAGKGHYTQEFAKTVASIDAVDGAVGIAALTNGYVQQADLTERLDLGVHDWVVCMEVGEHIPKDFELSVIDNIHRHNSEGVILSWAVLHQPGKGHINNHSNKYIKKLMDVLGYDNDMEAEKKAREITKLWWFEGSIMIFRRKKYPEL